MTSETGAEFVERIKREWDGDNVPCVEDFDQLIALARRGAAMQWRPIEEAPKDGTRIQVGYYDSYGDWRVKIARWWMPFEGADLRQCYWEYDGNKCLLDASIHSVGATHWMPLPPPPAGETSDE